MSEDRHASIGIHGLHPHAAAHGIRRLQLYRRAKWIAVCVILILLTGAAIVIGLRLARATELKSAARSQSQLFVTVVSPKRAVAASTLALPGTLQGAVEAPIYSRTSGYVQRWYKDIGEQVKQGDLLAQLAVPEVAQQLLEARAAQDSAATNAQLAKSTLARYEALRLRDAVSQQELDERRNTAALASATQAATAASVRRLQALVAYSRITAPFSGVVTKRNIDIGTLIDAGSNSRILFTVAQVDPLRVYVYVPQAYASKVRVGDRTEITFKEQPGKIYVGKIVRSAGAIDPATRTLQVEISLPNSDGKLLAGAYAQVAIKGLAANSEAITVPGNTLLFRPEGPRLAIVDQDGKVRLQAVTISRELAGAVELSDGLTLQDRVIINPADSLANGDVVNVVESAKPKADAVAVSAGAATIPPTNTPTNAPTIPPTNAPPTPPAASK